MEDRDGGSWGGGAEAREQGRLVLGKEEDFSGGPRAIPGGWHSQGKAMAA